MNSYVSNFIHRNISVPNLKETALRAAVSSNRTAVTVALNKYINKLSTDMPYADQIVSSLLNVMEYIPLSESVVINNYDSETDKDMTMQVPDEQANELYDGLILGAPNKALEVSDSDGYVYQLIFETDENGRKVIKTTANPIDFRDYLLYYDYQLHSYIINGILKSIGFFRKGDPYVQPTTIRDTLLVMADYLDSPYEVKDIHGFLCNVTGLSAESTAIDAVHELANRYECEFTGQILTTLINVCQVMEHRFIPANYGIKRTLTRVIHDITVNSTINDMIIKVGTLVCNGLNDIAILTSQLKEYIDSKINAVKELANNLSNAFALGGWYGLAMYLIDVIKGVSSIQSADGQLIFTDNESQVPAQYIAGIVSHVVGSVISAAGMILAAIHPAIGAIAGLVGSILGAVPLAARYDYERNTTAAAVTSDELVLPYSPLAFLQDQFEATGIWLDILNICQEQSCLCYFDVPGGCILCGASDVVRQIRVEFHPSCVVNMPQLGHNIQNTGSFKTYRAFQYKDITRDALETYWRSVLESPQFVENHDGGVLSDLSDKKLRRATMSHVGLFAAWLLNLGYQGEDPAYAEKWIAVPTSDWNGSAPEGWANFGGFSWGHCLSMFLYPFGTGDHNAQFSWSNIASAAADMARKKTFEYTIYEVNTSSSSTGSEVTLPAITGWNSYYLPHNDFSHMISNPQAVNTFEYYFKLPKYDRSTFLAWVILSVVVTAVATVATIVTSVKIKKWRAMKRAKLTSKVANNWDAYQNSMQDYDPSDEDDKPEYHTPEARKDAYRQYFKSVKRNNRWAGIVGGTRYSLAGYWDTDPEPSPDDEEVIDSSSMLNYFQSTDETGVDIKPEDADNYGSIETVIKLIRGS